MLAMNNFFVVVWKEVGSKQANGRKEEGVFAWTQALLLLLLLLLCNYMQRSRCD